MIRKTGLMFGVIAELAKSLTVHVSFENIALQIDVEFCFEIWTVSGLPFDQASFQFNSLALCSRTTRKWRPVTEVRAVRPSASDAPASVGSKLWPTNWLAAVMQPTRPKLPGARNFHKNPTPAELGEGAVAQGRTSPAHFFQGSDAQGRRQLRRFGRFNDRAEQRKHHEAPSCCFELTGGGPGGWAKESWGGQRCVLVGRWTRLDVSSEQRLEVQKEARDGSRCLDECSCRVIDSAVEQTRLNENVCSLLNWSWTNAVRCPPFEICS